MLKFYRLKRNNPKEPNLVLVATFNGTDYFIKIGGTQISPELRTKQVTLTELIPKEFILTRAEFHATRLFVQQNTLSNAELVTEEQARAEELINIDSGFSFSDIHEDDDFEKIFYKLRNSERAKLDDRYFFDMLTNQQIRNEMMKTHLGNFSNLPPTHPAEYKPKK